MSADRLREAAATLRAAALLREQQGRVDMALAEWLAAAARDEEAAAVTAGSGDRYPLAVADAILGGDR